ncbi:Glucose--fructose oxidoreductase [Planctomycetales bacterium 10988]|nr:Glucose--fructose oxidoreductase [Planctomycetales bacterium 10988]
MNLTPEEKRIGKNNFNEYINKTRSDMLTRREFLAASAVAAAVPSVGLGTFYFGYNKVKDPIRVGVIGTGDEGSVLISNINPDYLQVVAISDIRPYNQWRAFHGDQRSPGTYAARQGLMNVYGWKSEDEAKKKVKVYEDYKELLKQSDIEAVIIAVPLVQHHPIAMAAMQAGKHVLTEKLMAHDIAQCKEMGRTSQEQNLLLATGHQRHYSVLYDNAVHTIRQDVIGKIHHIRAQWHRNNSPLKDSWKPPLPHEWADELKSVSEKLDRAKSAADIERYQKAKTLLEMQLLDKTVDAAKYGYQGGTVPGEGSLEPYTYGALEELIRWRLWDRTGGGLMAELGSHQLDAASIFISALREDGKKVRPLAVYCNGGRHTFTNDRDSADHVYCTYEFPAQPYFDTDSGYKYDGYEQDPEKKIVVTYSSINGNGYGGYGEVVAGTKGTMILDAEKDAYLFLGASTKTQITVKKDAAVSAYETAGGTIDAVETNALGSYPPSRGYQEEMEHFAWCIRNRDPENKPRCYPEVAMADAILALTANISMKLNRRIEFKEEWFDMDHPDCPEDLLKNPSVV